MPSEVEAQIAWGFMAQPGDPFARELCKALGPREALARVVGNGSVSRVTAGIALEDTPLTAAQRERLKAAYDPDTVRRSMALRNRVKGWWREAPPRLGRRREAPCAPRRGREAPLRPLSGGAQARERRDGAKRLCASAPQARRGAARRGVAMLRCHLIHLSTHPS